MTALNKKKLYAILLASAYAVAIFAIVINSVNLFRNLYFESIYVNGGSMNPTFSGDTNNADYGIIDKSDGAKKSIKRYQIVTTYYPNSTDSYKIKRVIALPGDTFKIEHNNLYLYNSDTQTWGDALDMPFSRNLGLVEKSYEPTTLKSDEYFLAGDNWSNSLDSFVIGPVNYTYLVGVLVEMQGKCTVKNGVVTDKRPEPVRYFLGVDY